MFELLTSSRVEFPGVVWGLLDELNRFLREVWTGKGAGMGVRWCVAGRNGACA